MSNTDREVPVSMGEWMVTLLLMAIPIVNLIMVLVWAFGGGAPLSKANWAKAMLVWMLIGIVLWVVLAVFMGAAMVALTRQTV